jgi:hypothetical protein
LPYFGLKLKNAKFSGDKCIDFANFREQIILLYLKESTYLTALFFLLKNKQGKKGISSLIKEGSSNEVCART